MEDVFGDRRRESLSQRFADNDAGRFIIVHDDDPVQSLKPSIPAGNPTGVVWSTKLGSSTEI